MIEIFVAVFEFFLILSASYGISFFFLRKEPTDIIFENIVIRITLGFGVISFITLIAGGFRFLNISFFIIVILVGNVMFFKYIVFLKNVKINIKFSWLGLILFIFIIINLFFSLFPPTFHDSMVYHLAVPSYYIMHGGIVPWNTNFNSNLPLNVEMLYLFSLLGKTVFVPKLLSFFAGIAILLLMFSWCRAQFSKHFFMIPLLLFYTIPEIGFLTSSSKTEMIGMLFLFVAFRFFFLYVKKLSEIRFLILSGVFWGLAIGTKYTFAFFLMGFLVSLVFFKPLKFTKRLFTIFMILILEINKIYLNAIKTPSDQ